VLSDLWPKWLTASSLHLSIAKDIAILSNLSLEAAQHRSHRAQVKRLHCDAACDSYGITKTTAMDCPKDLSLALKQRRIIKHPDFEQQEIRSHVVFRGNNDISQPEIGKQPTDCCERRPSTPSTAQRITPQLRMITECLRAFTSLTSRRVSGNSLAQASRLVRSARACSSAASAHFKRHS
jgi:hypothetical protein